jgi:hypothetical protein
VTRPAGGEALVLAGGFIVPAAEMWSLQDSQLAQLAEIRMLLGVTFPTETHALAWLNRQVPLLGGSRFLEWIRRHEYGGVLGMLSGLYSGAFGQ